MSQVSTGIMTLMVLALAATGCTKTSFSGGNGKKEAEPKTASGETTLPPGNGDAQPAPEDTTSQPPSTTTTTPEQTQEQPEVTTDIQSATRYEDDFTGGIVSATKPVDIIIAVDTSGSMKDEALRVQSQLSDLVDGILSAKENIDFHIWLIGAVNLEQLTDEQRDKVTQLKTTVSSTNSLQILSAFLKGQLTSMLNANISQIRTNSQKELLVITDDNAAANSVPLFQDTIASRADLTGSTSLNGFVWLPTSQTTPTCTKAKEGVAYIRLASDPKYAGLMQDLCASDWTKLFSNLSDKIISKVSVVEFRLERPANAKTIVVTVDGKIADSSTWKYDAGKNALTFAPEKAPADGAKVLVIYSGI